MFAWCILEEPEKYPQAQEFNKNHAFSSGNLHRHGRLEPPLVRFSEKTKKETKETHSKRQCCYDDYSTRRTSRNKRINAKSGEK
jgi:hypothetical protein